MEVFSSSFKFLSVFLLTPSDDGFDTAPEGDWDDSFPTEPIPLEIENPVILFQRFHLRFAYPILF